MKCSLDWIVLPHLNYKPLRNDKVASTYWNLCECICNVNHTDDIQVNLVLLEPAANVLRPDDKKKILDLMESKCPQVDVSFASLDNKSQESECFIESIANLIDQSSADYVFFGSPDCVINANFFPALFPSMQLKRDLIKANVYRSSFVLLKDAFYEELLEFNPEFICKNFGSFVMRREYLIDEGFIGYIKSFKFSDLELCLALNATVRSSMSKWQERLNLVGDEGYTGTLTQRQKYDLSKENDFIDNIEDKCFLCVLDNACISLPEYGFADVAEVARTRERLVELFQEANASNVSLFAYILLQFYYESASSKDIEVNQLVIIESCGLYQWLKKIICKQGNYDISLLTLKSSIDDLAHDSIVSYFEGQNHFMLQERSYQHQVHLSIKQSEILLKAKSAQKYLLESYNQQMAKDCKLCTPVWPRVHTSTAEQRERLFNFAQPVPAFFTADASKVNSVVSGEDIDGHCPVSIVSVVNDIPLFQSGYMSSPILASQNCTLYPLLNPDPSEPEIVRGMTTLYNRFLDEYDYSKPSWMVFVHNDISILADLDMLADLPKDRLYGPCAAYTSCHNKKIASIYCYCTEYNENKGVYKLLFRENSDISLKNNTVDSEVETFDCVCLIVHSSLVEKHHLRFDENLRFDMVVEDFCLNAKVNHGIKSQVIDFAVQHISNGRQIPLSYYAALKYVCSKYPELQSVGTCSLIGGGVPLDLILANLDQKV